MSKTKQYTKSDRPKKGILKLPGCKLVKPMSFQTSAN